VRIYADPDPKKAFVNLEVSAGARESGQLCSAVQQVCRQEESVNKLGLPTSKYKQRKNLNIIPKQFF
jgi:hypothetical protein